MSILPNYHQKKDVMALWECQSVSLINTTQNNLQSLDSTDMLQTIQDSDIDLQLTHERPTREYSSNIGCSGIMGVPISFLDKYNPEQFEILGATQRGCHDEVPDTKRYDDYWEVKQSGEKTGSSGSKTNENANLLQNDGKHNYFINNEGRIIQSVYQRIFIRFRGGGITYGYDIKN